jgi:PAS domain-containing protein
MTGFRRSPEYIAGKAVVGSAIADVNSSERDASLTALLHEVDRLRASEESLRAEVAELLDAQSQFEATHAHKAEMYDFVPVACLTLDRFGAIRAANRAALSLLRLDGPQLLGAPLLCLLAPVHRPRFLSHLAACRRNGKDVAFEVLLKGEGHLGIPVRLLLRAAECGGYCVALVDLREREAAFADSARFAESQRVAHQVDQLKNRLIVLLNRGFRGPLGRVAAVASKLAARGALDPSVSVPLAELLEAASLLDHRKRRRGVAGSHLPHQIRVLGASNRAPGVAGAPSPQLRNRSR